MHLPSVVIISTKDFKGALRKSPFYACFLDAGSRVGALWVPSVDGCCGLQWESEWRRGITWKLDVEKWISQEYKSSLHLEMCCLVPVFSAFLYRSLALEGGKIVHWLKKSCVSERLLGKSLKFRLSPLFLSAGINVMENCWRRLLQNTDLLGFVWF